MLFTGAVNDSGNPHFSGSPDWSLAAINHNRKQFGAIEVVTEQSPEYRAMVSAAMPVYGEVVRANWSFGTLSNYLAMRRFLEGNWDEMIWLEADMIRNPNVPFPKRYGVCQTKVWDNPNYTPTEIERQKKIFCESFVGKPTRPYNHMMSSWMRLVRADVEAIVDGLHSIGLDLFKTEAWQSLRDCERSVGSGDLLMYSDMVLELSWMVTDWVAGNVFNMLGWVSYDDDYKTKPIIHFDAENKRHIIEYLKTIRR